MKPQDRFSAAFETFLNAEKKRSDCFSQEEKQDAFLKAGRTQSDLFECALRKIRDDSIKIASLEGDIASLKMSFQSIKLQAMCMEMDIMRNELSNLESLCVKIKQTINEAEST